MIVIIAGKAGSGKSTLRKGLLREFPSFSKSISYTTRPPREGEVNGVDYRFVSQENFLKNPGIFLKREENGNFYGVHKDSFCGQNVLSILDLNGINEITHFLPQEDIRLIYLAVPHSVLIDRLTQRGTPQPIIFKRLVRDQNINQHNLETNFPHLPLLVLENTSLEDSLRKSVQFIKQTSLQRIYTFQKPDLQR